MTIGFKAKDTLNYVPVTVDTFKEWEAKFQGEMARKRAEEE